jgi:hypothetical protein
MKRLTGCITTMDITFLYALRIDYRHRRNMTTFEEIDKTKEMKELYSYNIILVT